MTISQQLEEVAQQICDLYCKYPAQYEDEDEIYKVCENCPLTTKI